MTLSTHSRADRPRLHIAHHPALGLAERLAELVLRRLQLQWQYYVVVIEPSPDPDGTQSTYLHDRLDIESQLTGLIQAYRGACICHACHTVSDSPQSTLVWMTCTHCLCRTCEAALLEPSPSPASSDRVCPLCWHRTRPIGDGTDFTLTMGCPQEPTVLPDREIAKSSEVRS